MSEETELSGKIMNLELDSDEVDNNMNQVSSLNKFSYKDRKLEGKLKKYESILHKSENVSRVTDESQFLFVGNCGLENNISYEFVEETFKQFGKLIDVIMPKKKPYSFVIFENESSTRLAIEKLQGQVITKNQTDICFYLFPVDKVPELNLNEFEPTSDLPQGLVYIDDFIDSSYANQILDFVNQTNSENTLKKRKVKHYGFEFRYGTNDCDETKQLNGNEDKMPEVCNRLLDKMLSEGIIRERPDQLTVNFYEPGQGIGPHVDNPNAFDDFIVSLSLASGVVMEFRQKDAKKFSKIYLKPNSLLVLKKESRYNWTHSIAERKHDILDLNGHLKVLKRDKRVSLTFRKVKSQNAPSKQKEKEPELNLPMNDSEARNFELSHVHTVYNKIADHFSQTRHSAWPGVAKFIESMEPYSQMIDVGCGNGKYLNLRKDLFCFGCDYSDELIRICYERGFNCFVSDCLKIPCRTNQFDYAICIAVLHHLSTKERRIKGIIELSRIIKPGGKALVTVWAKEQKYKEKESFYIASKSQKKSTSNQEGSSTNRERKAIEAKKEEKRAVEANTNDKDSVVHTFGKEFKKSDLFVAWRLNPKVANSKTKEETVQSSESNNLFLRYYHVFQQNELEALFEFVPGVRVVESFYEQGNWCVIFQKESTG